MVVRSPDRFTVTLEPDGFAPSRARLTALAFGVAAAAPPFPSLGRLCLRVRAASGLIAAIAVAVAPVAGLIIAAAIVGVGELIIYVRLLPEVERLAQMVERTEASPADAGLAHELAFSQVDGRDFLHIDAPEYD
ncbi:hypothetical protein [Dactylosporangium sp. NPDC049140]|uniref:hypothetical protein n=1 Tax=Dactylosporangium sp. NPDC049140 TaxID=3155647 RepID=UPI0033E1C287